ncbi:Protein SVP26 [Lachancea thermotolerans]|uniref:KLTH0B08624p n=1 Tax=Lachancea thermotolerans (strain ATCC 56472 / CBS 6340 / NRRL Y-8284) TaxID=559295 RepID=C5DD63_LACTC|nr:KLTH0B08624p [Lachancea thermotolerans CBS 6340]CAR21724.1 KLTH0B08624p [Lachancea thermotolerans CBS 6340]
MILQALSYAGTVLGFLFLTLSIASGLYYISELVEEHSEPTKRFLTRAIYGIIILYVFLLILDSFPFKLSVFSIVSYLVYLQNLKHFPFISLKSPTLLASCVLVALNHYFWFKHFNDTEVPPQFRYDPNYIPRRRASFTEVASFFGICVWFVPFALFVSLSAGDNVLPTTTAGLAKKSDSADANSPRFRKKATGLVRVVIDSIRAYFYSAARVFGYDIDPNRGRLVV